MFEVLAAEAFAEKEPGKSTDVEKSEDALQWIIELNVHAHSGYFGIQDPSTCLSPTGGVLLQCEGQFVGRVLHYFYAFSCVQIPVGLKPLASTCHRDATH